MKKIIFLLFLLASCQTCKDTTLIEIPEPESTDIFRCKVNGVDWEPDALSGLLGDEIDLYYLHPGLSLSAKRDVDDINQFMTMSVSLYDTILGKRLIGTNKIFIDWNATNDCVNYYRDSTAENFIDVIQIDSLESTIEGNFQFTGVAPQCNDKLVEVTDGYFYLKYRN